MVTDQEVWVNADVSGTHVHCIEEPVSSVPLTPTYRGGRGTKIVKGGWRKKRVKGRRGTAGSVNDDTVRHRGFRSGKPREKGLSAPLIKNKTEWSEDRRELSTPIYLSRSLSSFVREDPRTAEKKNCEEEGGSEKKSGWGGGGRKGRG